MSRALCLCLLTACSGDKAPTDPEDPLDTAAPTTTTESTDLCRRGACDTTWTDTGTTEPTGASLRVTFSIAPNVAANMDEPAEGPFLGEVYRAEDVGALGPENGAEPLASIFVDNVVLPADGSPTGVLFEQQPVPPLNVVILGFLDTDGNNDPNDPGPDADDPVTLPGDNEFQLQPDVPNTVEVRFGLLNPF